MRHRALSLSLAAGLVFGCAGRSRAAAASPASAVAGAASVDPQYQDAYDRLVAAVGKDPAAAEVDTAAEALLQTAPPGDLASRAHLARAERAWLGADDLAATTWAGTGLPLAVDPDVSRALRRVRLRALTRGGDPAAAVALWEQVSDELPPDERLALHALALDRNADHEGALMALLTWRAALVAGDPAAAYAEDRARALLGGMGRSRVEAMARNAQGPVRTCLTHYLGDPPPRGAPAWIDACRERPVTVGLLLPRSGRYAALADPELAAVAAAVEVLRPDPDSVSIAWHDSGSGPDAARVGMEALVGAGVDVVVGPVDPASVRAAAAAAGGVPMVLPGEARAGVAGVAVPLEGRVRALIRHAGSRPLTVVGPDNGYGRRALQAASQAVQEIYGKSQKTLTYPADTTSFAKLVKAARIRRGGALLVADRVGRAELLLRQLRRSGWTVGAGPEDLLVLSTGEGVGSTLSGATLNGVVLAPVATAGRDAEAFLAAYERREGSPPGDHALLVFRAVRAALRGGQVPAAQPRLVAVQDRHLVPLETLRPTPGHRF